VGDPECTLPKWPYLFVKFADSLSLWSGRLFAFLVIPLTLTPVYEVISRQVFNRPTIWALEMTYMLCGTIGMMGAAYALEKKAHIRTDFFYDRWSPRIQGIVDSVFYLFFFLPGIALFCWKGWNFAMMSWIMKERAMMTSWYPPIYPFKMIMLIAGVLLLLQGVAELLRSIHAATSGRWQ